MDWKCPPPPLALFQKFIPFGSGILPLEWVCFLTSANLRRTCIWPKTWTKVWNKNFHVSLNLGFIKIELCNPKIVWGWCCTFYDWAYLQKIKWLQLPFLFCFQKENTPKLFTWWNVPRHSYCFSTIKSHYVLLNLSSWGNLYFGWLSIDQWLRIQ